MFASGQKLLPSWRDSSRPPCFLKLRSSKWLIGVTAFFAAFTDGFLYSTVVPVLPFSLVDRSGVSEDHVQLWVSILLATFGITMAIGAPIAGWFADRSSSRRIPLLIGFALAFFSTLVFCFARLRWLLIVARALQGLSASIIYTAGLALIADTVPAVEVGSWMGFVLSGMNLGALIAPFLAGAIYDNLGYYAVWVVCLGVVAFDFVLWVVMVEKHTAKRWIADDEPDISKVEGARDEADSVPPQEANPNSHETLDSTRSTRDQVTLSREHEPAEMDETSLLLQHPPRPRESWFLKNFPAMTTLLSSPRIRAAVFGCFTHTTLISAFDAVLPLFVKHTFRYTSTGAGLVFLAITIPSTLGTIIGALSDRYGTRLVSLLGFALTTPCLALMGLATDDSIGHQVTLISLLVVIGVGLNLILAPLAADMFDEVESLAKQNPDRFGSRGAYAQAYSLFDASLGLATVAGPTWSGVLLAKTNWQVTAGVLAILCAIGAVPVFGHTGKGVQRRQEDRNGIENGIGNGVGSEV